MKKQTVICSLLAALLLPVSSALQASAESDYRSGVDSYKAGDSETAAAYFESAMKQGMHSVSLLYNLASSYYKLGRYDESEKYFKQVYQVPEMKDISEYHLALIAIKQKDWNLARSYFNSVANSATDRKLASLSEKHLNALTKKEDSWKAFISSNLGYDDNISSVSGDSVLGESDTFYDVFASLDYLISGKRKHGWLADAYLYGINYTDTGNRDESKYSLGLKRTIRLGDWNTSTHASTARSNYAGDDFQNIYRLDIKASTASSKSGKLFLRYQLDDITSENMMYDYLEGWRQRARIELRQYSKYYINEIYYELELNDRGVLATPTYSYEYSPTHHTIRGKHTHLVSKHWWLNGELSYRSSDYPASISFDRKDTRWKLALTSDYLFDRTFKLSAKYEYTDNSSSENQYTYDKSVLKLGLSKLF